LLLYNGLISLTMFCFQVCQFVKDATACLVFILFANMPLVLNDSELLCLFFSLGCLLDSVFVSVRYYCTLPLTIASVKDMVGVIGMFFFTIMLAYPINVVDGFWQKFFYIAFLIDAVSVLSVSNGGHNVYSGTSVRSCFCR
jgi:hypothetical protein